MALRAVPDHPKFAQFKAIINQPKGAALGWLEAIWHFTGRFTPQGNIGKYTDEAIEAWVEWNGEPGRLVQALVAARWIDRDSEHRLLVHDWSQHADKATKNALNRAKLPFCSPAVRTQETPVRTTDTDLGTASRLPEPVPEPVPVPGAEPAPHESPLLQSPAPEIPDADPGAELMLAAWVLEESGIPSDSSLVRIAGSSIRLLAKERGDMRTAAQYILSQAIDARCRGETVNRFWFSDQRYRPHLTLKSRKQREVELAVATFTMGEL